MESFYAGDVIFSYTRAQAIADGVLVDASETAKEAGVVFPVAVTDAVWRGYVVPDDELRGSFGQSEQGRLWDILMVFVVAAKQSNGQQQIQFPVLFLMKPHAAGSETVLLKAHCGPGDHGEPVITIMLPHED